MMVLPRVAQAQPAAQRAARPGLPPKPSPARSTQRYTCVIIYLYLSYVVWCLPRVARAVSPGGQPDIYIYILLYMYISYDGVYLVVFTSRSTSAACGTESGAPWLFIERRAQRAVLRDIHVS